LQAVGRSRRKAPRSMGDAAAEFEILSCRWGDVIFWFVASVGRRSRPGFFGVTPSSQSLLRAPGSLRSPD
jgi:hypothetical protein